MMLLFSQDQGWDLGLEKWQNWTGQWIWSKGLQKLYIFFLLSLKCKNHWNLLRPFMAACDIWFLFSQVFSVNNVNVVIRTRTEHLTDEEKARIKSRWKICFMIYTSVLQCVYDGTEVGLLLFEGERNILESLLGTVEQHISAQGVKHAFGSHIKMMCVVPTWQLIWYECSIL